jgi:hypothetical protein
VATARTEQESVLVGRATSTVDDAVLDAVLFLLIEYDSIASSLSLTYSY